MPPVRTEQAGQVAELRDGKVGGQRRLPALLANDADAWAYNQSRASGTVNEMMRRTGREDVRTLPTSAAWIMLTSLPPSPIAQTLRWVAC